MPGRKKHTNPGLILLSVLLCLTAGIVFSQSSADPLPAEIQRMPDSIVADGNNSSALAPKGGEILQKQQDTFTSSENTPTPEPSKNAEKKAEPEKTPAPTATPEAEPEDSKSREISPEAEKGVWTASGSSWMFLVDGVPYTGWLTDTDGKSYYLTKKGIMYTGWLKRGGKRYYLDLDGIMQTGETVIDGKTYEFLEDGSLKESDSSQESPKTDPETAEDSKNAEAEDSGDSKKAGTEDSESSKKPEAEDSDGSKNAEAEKTDNSKKAEAEDSDGSQKTDTSKTSKTENGSSASSKKNKTSGNSGSADSAQKKKKGSVALTFDDGPSSFTDRLLDCLESNQVKATFFMVGEEVEYFPEAVKRMEDLGCELGNHSYSHQDLTELDSAGIADELNRTDSLIAAQAGHGATVVRPPYGSINDTVSACIPVPMILWSIDTLDWESQDPDAIVKTVMDEVSDGSVILMHDIYSTSVDAAEILIPKLISEGYDLVTIHELAKDHKTELSPGVAYGSITGN